MKCTRCSAEIPAQSRFCLRCGTPLQTAVLPTSVAPAAAAFPAPRQSSRPLIALIAALALAVLALGGFLLHGFLTQKPGETSGGQLVQKPGEGSAGSLVQAPGNSRPGAPVQAPAESNPNKIVQSPAPVVDTAAIDDYLRFVKRVDEQKMALTKQELAAALTSQASQLGRQAEAATDDLKSKEYLPGVARESAGIEREWDSLSKIFGARIPPPSCVGLRDAYYTYLGKVQGMFVKYHRALAEAQSDPGKAIAALTAMQGSASAEADNAARSADDALYDICKKYNLRKEFRIETDPSSSTGTIR